VQIRDQIIELLLGEGDAGHHVAAMKDRSLDKLVVGNQAAGQVRSLIESFHARAFRSFGAIRAVADGAVQFVDAATLNLLRIQTQFGIRLQLGVSSATGQQGQKNQNREDGRFSLQVTIMFCTAAF